MTAAMSVRGLSVVYPDGTEAIKKLDLEIADGETAALIGANGAGKTSLLLAMVGLAPFSGEVTVGGIASTPGTRSEIRRRIGFVFQNPDDQLFMPTIYEDTIFGPRNQGIPEVEAAARANEALSSMGIAHLGGRQPYKLSSGQKRLAQIATVLAMNPSLLLFDEPTAFLDPRARRNLVDVTRTLPHAKLIATHDLDFAASVCTRAIVLHEGAIFTDAPPSVVFSDSDLMESCGL